jgi:hypothetical protein
MTDRVFIAAAFAVMVAELSLAYSLALVVLG